MAESSPPLKDRRIATATLKVLRSIHGITSRFQASAGREGDEFVAAFQGGLSDPKPHALDERAPPWFYILREASVIDGGERFGPIAARISAKR